MSAIDYKEWASEYFNQEQELKAKISELRKRLDEIRRNPFGDEWYCLNDRINKLEDLYYEAKSIRHLLEKRGAK